MRRVVARIKVGTRAFDRWWYVETERLFLCALCAESKPALAKHAHWMQRVLDDKKREAQPKRAEAADALAVEQ